MNHILSEPKWRLKNVFSPAVCVSECLSQQISMFVCLRFLFLSADENKPIWMHAEEREEQSKVSVCKEQQYN